MLVINTSQVHLDSPMSLVAEASDLGLAPGEWPDFIAVVDDRNEGFLFGTPTKCLAKGFVEKVTYAVAGRQFTLTVYND